VEPTVDTSTTSAFSTSPLARRVGELTQMQKSLGRDEIDYAALAEGCPPSPTPAGLDRHAARESVMHFAAAWVRHSRQHSLVEDDERLHAYVLWHWGGWAWHKFRRHPHRPEALVDMAKGSLYAKEPRP
jgi:hypothetical protein